MDITYTKEEYDEFYKIYMATGSYGQVERINARMDMRAFVEKHGKDKCDAMYAKAHVDEVNDSMETEDD